MHQRSLCTLFVVVSLLASHAFAQIQTSVGAPERTSDDIYSGEPWDPPQDLLEGLQSVDQGGAPSAQGERVGTAGVSAQPGPIRVNVMPGYPNAPKLDPGERAPARPGEAFLVWGNANGGDGSAIGCNYTWSFSPNPNLAIQDNGDLSGVVDDDRLIDVEVTFQLLNGKLLEIVGATLTVDDGAGNVDSDFVEIVVVDRAFHGDVLEEQQHDVNMAIERGLRWLYLRQRADGDWNAYSGYRCAGTGYVLWAFHNQGHVPTLDPDESIYVDSIVRGLDRLLGAYPVIRVGSTGAPNATTGLGAVADGISDLNQNNQVVEMCTDNRRGYTHPVATLALISSLAPDRVVTTGNLQGMTYREVVEDAVDWLGSRMNRGSGTRGGRGGWNYTPSSSSNRSDMSINSWAFLAIEGAQDIFGIPVPDWIKREIEYTLASHMAKNTGSIPWGYTGPNPVLGAAHGQATTSGGLSGLVLAETQSVASPVLQTLWGDSVALQTGMTAQQQMRSNGLSYLGFRWNVNGNGNNAIGNRRNYYAMWTTARALRLTARAQGLPEGQGIQLVHGGENFDWDTGWQPDLGQIATPGAAREGYFTWLERTQRKTGSPYDVGAWNTSGATFFAGADMSTAWAVLVLTPRVFLSPCPVLIDIPIVGLQPTDGATFPVGSQLTISGRALQQGPSFPIAAVFVNGEQVDGLDATGTFFKTITIQPGINQISIQAFDGCGTDSAVLHVEGVDGSVGTLNSFQEFDTFFDVTYSNTTFNQETNQLIVEAEICNNYEQPVYGPVLMVFDQFMTPLADLANPDGYTANGRPYMSFFENVGDPLNSELGPGECSSKRVLKLDNPAQLPMNFRLSWLAAGNTAPYFTSTPMLSTRPDEAYFYGVAVSDLEQPNVSLALEVAPIGMVLDPVTHEIDWTPTQQDVGTHQVRLRASDGLGASTVQNWTIAVGTIGTSTGPPFFTTVPVVQAAVGSSYAYQAMAVDPDGEALTYSLTSSPGDMAIDSDGLVTWGFALPGLHPVGVRATDASGNYAEQQWTLAVGTVTSNPNAPQVTSSPGTLAIVNEPYLYQPVATDPDGDVLAFSLDTQVSPAGMQIDPATGLIQWTPGSANVGPNTVAMIVDDGNGASVTQFWVIDVSLSLPNVPPAIVSIPPTFAVQDVPYAYQVVGVDPDGDEDDLVFDLVTGPTGMTIDPDSGLVEWTPTAPEDVQVAVRATDPEGGQGSQAFLLSASGPNQPPTIVTGPLTTAPLAGTYVYDANATDPEGQTLGWELVSGPAEMTIDPVTGVVRWNASTLGDFGATIRVFDPFMGEDTQSWTITVEEDTTPPVVGVAFAQTPVFVGQAVEVCVTASDDVSVVSLSLSIDGQSIPLDPDGCGQWTSTIDGTFPFDATAADAAGNQGIFSGTVQVVDPNPQNAPVVDVTSPLPGTILTEPTELVGSIDDNTPQNLTWEVTLTRIATGDVTVVAQGAGTVQGTITTLDPTNLPNDTYLLEVTASDGSFETTRNGPYEVAGNNKLGSFVVSFTDIDVVVGGIPLTVTRQYSSLDTSPDDLGAGWRLGLPGQVCDTPEEGQGGFTPLTRVYVTREDGARVGFSVQYTALSFLFPFIGQLSLVPDPGVSEQLQIVGNANVFFDGGSFTSSLFSAPFNPDEYRLHTAGGLTYDLHEVDGLQRISDLYGNETLVTPGGLISSTGLSLIFERDAQGRIERVIEPDLDPNDGVPPAVHEYDYDGAGNLVTYRNPAGDEATYLYTNATLPNHLTDVMDPLGRPVIRSVYDADGRLLAQCGPDGDPNTLEGCLEFDLDPNAQFQTFFDGVGNRTDLVLDAFGRVLTEVKHLADGSILSTEQQFDPDGNRTMLIDPASNAWLFDWTGSELTEMTEPDGSIWTSTYDSEGRLLTSTNPAGATRSYDYDAEGRLIRAEDALGHATTYTYEAGGGLSTLTDPEGSDWTFRYDTYGRVREMEAPDGAILEYDLDLLGRLVRQVDRSGRETLFAYDAKGRVVSETWDDGRVIETDYNAADQATRVEDSTMRMDLEYWNTGRLRSLRTLIKATGFTTEISYARMEQGVEVPGYDGRGFVTDVMDGADGWTRYAYDALGRVAEATQQQAPGGAAAVLDKRAAWTYDDASLLRHLERQPALDPSSAPAMTTDLSYDCASCGNGIAQLLHENATGGTILLVDVTRDAGGWVETITDDLGPHTYTHDGTGRLNSADHPMTSSQPDEIYAYDAAGNRVFSHLSGTHVHRTATGDGNALTSDDRFSYAYDADGNLTSRIEVATGEELLLEYDNRHRLTRVTKEDATSQVLHEEQRIYDGRDRVVARIVNGVPTHVTYDGDNPILEQDAAGAATERRFYGRRIDDLLGIEVGGERLWPVHDQIRSVRKWIRDDGSEAGSLEYDSFGRITAESGSAANLAIGFQSRPLDRQTGLMDFRARPYDPWQGRFVREDPAPGFGYAFAENSPLVFRDPSGETALLDYTCIARDAISKLNSLKPFFVTQSYPLFALGTRWTDLTPEEAESVVRIMLEGMADNIFEFAFQNEAISPISGCGSTEQEIFNVFNFFQSQLTGQTIPTSVKDLVKLYLDHIWKGN